MITDFKPGDIVTSKTYCLEAKVLEGWHFKGPHKKSDEWFNSLKLWKPRKDTWCWNTEHGLVKVLNYVSREVVSVGTLTGYAGYPIGVKVSIRECEPFEGKLPSFANQRNFK